MTDEKCVVQRDMLLRASGSVGGPFGDADEAIEEWCRMHKEEPADTTSVEYEEYDRCKCLNMDRTLLSNIKKQGITGDHVCWYHPCMSAYEPYLTSSLEQKSRDCSTINCVIKDVDISVDGNVPVSVKNQCGTRSPDETAKEVIYKIVQEIVPSVPPEQTITIAAALLFGLIVIRLIS